MRRREPAAPERTYAQVELVAVLQTQVDVEGQPNLARHLDAHLNVGVLWIDAHEQMRELGLEFLKQLQSVPFHLVAHGRLAADALIGPLIILAMTPRRPFRERGLVHGAGLAFS